MHKLYGRMFSQYDFFSIISMEFDFIIARIGRKYDTIALEHGMLKLFFKTIQQTYRFESPF